MAWVSVFVGFSCVCPHPNQQHDMVRHLVWPWVCLLRRTLCAALRGSPSCLISQPAFCPDCLGGVCWPHHQAPSLHPYGDGLAAS